MIRNVNALAVTERGPAHRLNGEPNQDACLFSRGRYGVFVVVADGLGSRPHADHGSRNACLAARDAVRYWSENPLSPPERLAPLMQALWRTRIAPVHPEECATTCLFALRQQSGSWVIGGIGDGIAALRDGEGDMRYVIGAERTGFVNQTVGLGASRAASDWRFGVYPASRLPAVALLATDGVADDLIPEQSQSFAAWVAATLDGFPSRQRSNTVRVMLRRWPAANHSDDKSVGIIWESDQRGIDE